MFIHKFDFCFFFIFWQRIFFCLSFLKFSRRYSKSVPLLEIWKTILNWCHNKNSVEYRLKNAFCNTNWYISWILIFLIRLIILILKYIFSILLINLCWLMMLFKNWIFRNFSCFQSFRCLVIMLKIRHWKLTNLMFVFRFKKKIEILHRVSNFFERFHVFVIQNDIFIAFFIDRIKKKIFLFDLQFAF